uniref:Uncharacterized protein n=1 Tax=Lates calcarifer TaxID=8187 RepID=A0A4W6DLW8_LATCA
QAKKTCPAGQKWDSLLNTCIKTAPAIQDSAPSVMVLSPALWIFVVLATVGSILVLVLWMQSQHRSLFRKQSHPPQCTHCPQRETVTQGCFREQQRPLHPHAGTDGGGGLPACSTVREHRIPLPATELGGTALVTTKTV